MIDAGMTDQQRKSLSQELGIVGALLAVDGVRKHETRFANEVALVAPTKAREAVDRIVADRLGAAVKAAGSPTPTDLAQSSLCRALGGIRADQTLYRKSLDAELAVYVAFWPWGSGQQFTIKIGVHFEGAQT
jgi:hypothetical protein